MKKIICLGIVMILSIYTMVNTFADSSLPKVGQKQMKVHYIDVGQADSILIQSPEGKNILVDAGNVDDYEKVNTYLYQHGVGKLDVAIVTHPHEDHLGSMGKLVEKYKPDNIYISSVPKSVMNVDERYIIEKPEKDLEMAANSVGTIIQAAYSGMVIPIDNSIKLEVISPVKDKKYGLVNDYSITFKVKYLDTNFLFTGDIEKEAESDILQRYSNDLTYLKVDVLKVAHHGAISSSNPAFLIAAEPKYSIVSVGKNNPFGFPDQIISKRMMVMGEYYRTDANGTVVVTSDGYKIDVKKEKNEPAYSYNNWNVEQGR
ncbi:MAG: ComEC/Rec2 family competence protein [Filifactoraceae bacterium]